MKRTRAVNVGAVAGVTKVLQEVQLDKHVKLLDCPGVVMAKASENEEAAVLRNSKRIENVEDPVGPGELILFYHSEVTCGAIMTSMKCHMKSYCWQQKVFS